MFIFAMIHLCSFHTLEKLALNIKTDQKVVLERNLDIMTQDEVSLLLHSQHWPVLYVVKPILRTWTQLSKYKDALPSQGVCHIAVFKIALHLPSKWMDSWWSSCAGKRHVYTKSFTIFTILHPKSLLFCFFCWSVLVL